MKRFIAAFAALVISLTACSSSDEYEPTVFATEGDLVSEADLLLRAAKTFAGQASLTMATIMSQHDQRLQICYDRGDNGVIDNEWNDKRVLSVGVDTGSSNACDNEHISFNWYFGNSVYVDGQVTQGKCTQLPGAGTVTSGEHTTFDDQGVEYHVNEKHGIEESSSHETSLNENVDTTSETTGEIEGGVPFGGSAKLTERVEAHFGLEKGSLDSKSTTTTREVELDFSVKAGQTIEAIYTLDESATDCERDIESQVDWTTIKMEAKLSECEHICRQSPNLHTLTSHGIEGTGSGYWINIEFSGVEDLREFIHGGNTLCDGCDFDLSAADPLGRGALSAEDARHRLEYQPGHYRTLEFNGTTRSVVKDSASYIIRDVSGFDQDCVSDALTDEGTPVTDGILDHCKP